MNEVSIRVSYIFGSNKNCKETERKMGSKSEKKRGQVKGPSREVELTHGN